MKIRYKLTKRELISHGIVKKYQLLKDEIFKQALNKTASSAPAGDIYYSANDKIKIKILCHQCVVKSNLQVTNALLSRHQSTQRDGVSLHRFQLPVRNPPAPCQGSGRQGTWHCVSPCKHPHDLLLPSPSCRRTSPLPLDAALKPEH